MSSDAEAKRSRWRVELALPVVVGLVVGGASWLVVDDGVVAARIGGACAWVVLVAATVVGLRADRRAGRSVELFNSFMSAWWWVCYFGLSYGLAWALPAALVMVVAGVARGVRTIALDPDRG
ncbi:MAG: hypothetical protein JWO68_2559 [Actinomycetia bacterium]|nr:hypothetical protein [Actinomycetes bacterium]